MSASAVPDQASKIDDRLIHAKVIPLLIILAVAVMAWCLSPPAGLTIAAYHTAVIFISLIAAIVANVMPTGAVAIVGLAVYAVLQAGGEPSNKAALLASMKEFDNLLIWLIVIAFMIARSFAKTGLGRRIALILLSRFGKSTLHIAYCLGLADYIIAPVTPSNTARSAIVSPIAESLAKTINKGDRKLGQYLMSSVSAMNDASAVGFMTGFAGNLALVGIAAKVLDIDLTFSIWASYLLIPSLALLVIIPALLFKVVNPDTKATPEAQGFARKELVDMGPLKSVEWKLLFVFVMLLVLWVGGKTLGLHSTSSALIGLASLLLLGVLDWNDIKSEKGAWDTLIWFSVLMGMAGQLKVLGFTGWVGNGVADVIQSGFSGSSSTFVLILMMTFYLFTAYFFASGTAKVVALGPVILGALVSLGVDPMMSVLAVAGVTNLGCNLTTYSHARNPLLMGYGYHTSNEWMRNGLIISISGYVIFMTVGLLWWSVIGY